MPIKGMTLRTVSPTGVLQKKQAPYSSGLHLVRYSVVTFVT